MNVGVRLICMVLQVLCGERCMCWKCREAKTPAIRERRVVVYRLRMPAQRLDMSATSRGPTG